MTATEELVGVAVGVFTLGATMKLLDEAFDSKNTMWKEHDKNMKNFTLWPDLKR